jgi:hypothetical protein
LAAASVFGVAGAAARLRPPTIGWKTVRSRRRPSIGSRPAARAVEPWRYEGVVDPEGPVGDAEKTILLNALGVMLVVVTPVIVATLAFGVLIVFLVINGSLWIIANLDHNMAPMSRVMAMQR